MEASNEPTESEARPVERSLLGSVNPTGKLSDRVVASLEMAILRGDIPVGERLPTEAELGEQLGVSRTVVRDAVRTLIARGLVVVRQGRGTFVAPSTGDALGLAAVLLFVRSGMTVGELIDTRTVLDGRLLPLAAKNRTDEDCVKAGESLDAFSLAVEEERWADAHAAHLQFHLDLFHAIQMPVLEVMLKPLAEIIIISSIPPRGEDRELWEVEAHAPILEGMVNRDEDAISTAVKAHYEYMQAEPYTSLRETELRDAVKVESLMEYMGRHKSASAEREGSAPSDRKVVVGPLTENGGVS